jgi:hypothetical protein
VPLRGAPEPLRGAEPRPRRCLEDVYEARGHRTGYLAPGDIGSALLCGKIA